MPNIRADELWDEDGYRRARLAAEAGAEHLGLTVYELPRGTGMHFHYHLQREELLVVLEGTLALRTAAGDSETANTCGERAPGVSALPDGAAPVAVGTFGAAGTGVSMRSRPWVKRRAPARRA